jgi:hypothetical protein
VLHTRTQVLSEDERTRLIGNIVESLGQARKDVQGASRRPYSALFRSSCCCWWCRLLPCERWLRCAHAHALVLASHVALPFRVPFSAFLRVAGRMIDVFTRVDKNFGRRVGEGVLKVKGAAL